MLLELFFCTHLLLLFCLLKAMYHYVLYINMGLTFVPQFMCRRVQEPCVTLHHCCSKREFGAEGLVGSASWYCFNLIVCRSVHFWYWFVTCSFHLLFFRHNYLHDEPMRVTFVGQFFFYFLHLLTVFTWKQWFNQIQSEFTSDSTRYLLNSMTLDRDTEDYI